MEKLNKLKKILKKMGSAVLAYSGGLDSTFLMKVAADCLGDKLLAVTAVSATYQAEELDFSRKMAARFKIRHLIIRTTELRQRKFSANSRQRCYFCKRELFGRLKDIAGKKKMNFVIDASNLSDISDFRPGSKAKQEFRVRSPLQEAGMDKADIRNLSRSLGLPSWNKPSLACLASRIPYGRKISPGILKKVEQAEKLLRQHGLGQVRVRHYDGLCRIEVLPPDFPKVMRKRNDIVNGLKAIGYSYITLDLQGYRTGSMNEVVRK